MLAGNMNTSLQLHNAARRYCADRFAYWSSAYQKLYGEGKASVGSGYSDDASDAFARCKALSAVLNEIERMDADELPEYSDLSDLLILAGQIAESPLSPAAASRRLGFAESPISETEAAAMQDQRDDIAEALRGLTPESFAALPEVLAREIAETQFTESPILPVEDLRELTLMGARSAIQAAAIQDERDEFVEALRKFTPESIAALPALPYRRVLSTAEVASLWKRVAARWGGSHGKIYPLAERTDSSLRAYDDEAFDKEFPAERLQSILRSRGVERIYELREYGDENYLMSIDCWEPYYDAEGTWFSDPLDWVMFWSHEGSVTTGGALTDSIVSQWKDVGSHAPWFFDNDHPWFP